MNDFTTYKYLFEEYKNNIAFFTEMFFEKVYYIVNNFGKELKDCEDEKNKKFYYEFDKYTTFDLETDIYDFIEMQQSVINYLLSSFLIQLYHIWEQDISSFIKSCFNEPKFRFKKLSEVFEKKGFNLGNKIENINELRLIVNVLKHGTGDSFDEMNAKYPEFIFNKDMFDKKNEIGFYWINNIFMYLNLSKEKSVLFKDVLISFWESVSGEFDDEGGEFDEACSKYGLYIVNIISYCWMFKK